MQEEPYKPLLDWSSIRLELIWIYDDVVPPEHRQTTIRRPNEWSAWLLRKGTVTLEGNGRRWTAKAGDWVFCTGDLLQQQFSTEAAILSLHFQLIPPEHEPLFEGGPCIIFKASRFPALERYALRLDAAVRQRINTGDSRLLWQSQAGYRTYLKFRQVFDAWFESSLAAMLESGLSFSHAASLDQRVLLAQRFLNSAKINEPFPRRQLEIECGLSLSGIDRLFARALGITARRYFENRRYLLARSAVERGEQSVKLVAYQLGFRQVSHFSAWFKRYSGSSPRKYRHQGPS